MNKLIAITLCMFLCVACFSQREHPVLKEKMANIKAKKIAFITDELSLTPEQAEKFWPLYNEYSEKTKEQRNVKIKGNRDRNGQSASDEEFLSDDQAMAMLNEMIKNEEEKLQSKKEFVSKLKSFLKTQQILQLFRAEKKFKRNIFRDYKKKVRVIKLK